MLKDELWCGPICKYKLKKAAKKALAKKAETVDAKADLIKIGGSFGGIKGGIQFDDNSLTCDSAGNCMLKDDLIKFGASGCAFGVCANIKTADNALTCDSEGNCMLKDKLLKIGGSFGGIKAGIQI